jgi:5-oxoprolinase (ATP-hydrolysing) subunit B
VSDARSARPFPRISPLGDAALTIAFADQLDARARDQVLALRDTLSDDRPPGMIELVPAHVALTVHYEPSEIDYSTLRDLIRRAMRSPAASSPAPARAGRLVEIPVVYDGPDLAEVAEATGLDVAQVIDRHRQREYQVAVLGFVPGFAYLTELDPALVLPRRSTPRPRVPAGSVAIAGGQTGIYPAATPGGWHLIGRTAIRLFDPTREPAALLAVGDRVRFVDER